MDDTESILTGPVCVCIPVFDFSGGLLGSDEGHGSGV